ncbi:hypothetical protein H5410_058589 [Solanum commersonii]|uniref:Uncharacterized protein n=1 Tax=Solanum commersonii TaxID=4109 RepID=A0A9J5WT46_SOLCO|nr:hypothetical protein H5410_058589 [Solanum commersonii]
MFHTGWSLIAEFCLTVPIDKSAIKNLGVLLGSYQVNVFTAMSNDLQSQHPYENAKLEMQKILLGCTSGVHGETFAQCPLETSVYWSSIL